MPKIDPHSLQQKVVTNAEGTSGTGSARNDIPAKSDLQCGQRGRTSSVFNCSITEPPFIVVSHKIRAARMIAGQKENTVSLLALTKEVDPTRS
jgi:hypothetical protein